MKKLILYSIPIVILFLCLAVHRLNWIKNSASFRKMGTKKESNIALNQDVKIEFLQTEELPLAYFRDEEADTLYVNRDKIEHIKWFGKEDCNEQ